MRDTTTAPGPTDRVDLLAVLDSQGWSSVSAGPIGELWASPEGRRVGIPFELTQASREWDGVIERVADGLHTATATVAEQLRGLWTDVFEFRAGTAFVSSHTISAAAGSDLFQSVWTILRASATAAQTPQPKITNWSRVGDRVVADAQFGQTRPGSYILPLFVPLRRTTTAEAQRSKDDTLFVSAREPEERRVTRTMHEALQAFQTAVIDRDRVPSEAEVGELVSFGVTRELLTSIQKVIVHHDVSSLDIDPIWATAVGTDTAAMSGGISIPAEAADLLEHAIPKFKRVKKPVAEVLTGPIYRMLDREGSGHGIATIDTRRGGRLASVDIFIEGNDLVRQAHDWFRDHTTVHVQGTVDRTSAGSVIRKPAEIHALGESMLFG